MKKYMLFGGAHHQRLGGFNDFICDSESIEYLIQCAKNIEPVFEGPIFDNEYISWAHISDGDKIIKQWRRSHSLDNSEVWS